MSSFMSKLQKDFEEFSQDNNVNLALTNPLGFVEKVYDHTRLEVIGMPSFKHLVFQEYIHLYRQEL